MKALIERNLMEISNPISKNMYKKFNFLFEGEPIDLTSKMIFDAHELPDGIKEKVVSMMFLLVQKIISQMPSKMKKIVVIDEAWAYLGYDRSSGQLMFPAYCEVHGEIGAGREA